MISSKTSLLINRVRHAFSKAADQYDLLASLQREIGQELIEKIVALPEMRCVLDIGCGTGYMAGKVKSFFPQSHVVGVDFSQQMLLKAQENVRDVSWVLADAHQLPFKEKSVEVVVSNLAYQWAFDLKGALVDVRRVLCNNGTFVASLFGFSTCQELFVSLQATGTKGEGFNRLPRMEEVKESLLRAGFLDSQVNNKNVQIQFKDLWDLLGWLKAIGANELSSGRFLGPQALQEANMYCLKNYPADGGINITFEVIWIYAKV
ncbi:MAG: methyltransferase domain-containing protein [Candidatus Omnitrophota bacterium]